MIEMVERVAKAICKSRTCEGMMCCQWPANRGRLTCPVAGRGYDDAARAAIEAMREPTGGMNIVLDDDEVDLAIQSPDWRRLVWQAMIDAALQGEVAASRQST